MQVIQSLFLAASVGEWIERTYDVGGMQTCRLHMSGVNDVYEVRSERGVFFFKVYRLHWRSIENVRYETDLLRHLSRAGVSVAHSIRTRAGEHALLVDAPEGSRPAVLYEAAPGKAPAWPFYRDAHEARLLGTALARIHNAGRTFASRYARDPINAPTLTDAPLATILSVADLLSIDAQPFTDAVAALRSQLDAFVARGVTSSVCHGDFHCGNVFLTDGGQVTTFDFDACGPGWVAHDLARWRSLTEDPDGAESWNAFLAGYEKVAPLTDADKDAVPLFVALRALHWADIKLSFVRQGQGEWWDVGFFLNDLLGQIAR